ncbi:hypothetical protein AAH678_18420 [Sodalis endosymbiont of Spalangia cameroni]|uniref:hypothetical protein n=1 Tax=Sodalis praecaptivus TaxID=1239307 RepID=UPI0031F7B732
MSHNTTPPMTEVNSNGLYSNIFIRIRDKRTPCGNCFFRLDQLHWVSIADNRGLTPILKFSDRYIEPSITYEQFIDFMSRVINDIKSNPEHVKIYEIVITDSTVREQHPRTKIAVNLS